MGQGPFHLVILRCSDLSHLLVCPTWRIMSRFEVGCTSLSLTAPLALGRCWFSLWSSLSWAWIKGSGFLSSCAIDRKCIKPADIRAGSYFKDHPGSAPSSILQAGKLRPKEIQRLAQSQQLIYGRIGTQTQVSWLLGLGSTTLGLSFPIGTRKELAPMKCKEPLELTCGASIPEGLLGLWGSPAM